MVIFNNYVVEMSVLQQTNRWVILYLDNMLYTVDMITSSFHEKLVMRV